MNLFQQITTYLKNAFRLTPEMFRFTPEEEAKALARIFYLVAVFTITGIVVAIYGMAKGWNAKNTAKIMIPIMVIFLFTSGWILHIPWFLMLPLALVAVLASIGWMVIIPKIRQQYLSLSGRKKRD